jgi:hypothetical protein
MTETTLPKGYAASLQWGATRSNVQPVKYLTAAMITLQKQGKVGHFDPVAVAIYTDEEK